MKRRGNPGPAAGGPSAAASSAASAAEVYSTEVERAPFWVFEKLAPLADRWGGSFDAKTGRLELPVLAGLRHGVLIGEVEALAHQGGAKVRLRVSSCHYALDRGSTFSLSLAAVAAFAALVLPFFRQLWPLLPPALAIAIAAWLFIIARLRTSSAEDFLADLRQQAATADVPAGAEED